MNAMPNPWIFEVEDHFILDEEAFLNDIEPLPAFLISPRQEYLKAAELIPVLRVLAGVNE